jgi:hypothetical protein
MANPTPYARAFSFTGNQAGNAYAPPPGVKVDAELDQVAAAIQGTNAALASVRRADGTVADASVTAESLTPAAIAALSAHTVLENSVIGSIPAFATRALLAAGNVGHARRVHVVRYYSDGPVANIIYDLVSSAPARDATSMAVTGLDGSNANVTLYTSLANSPVLPEHFGAYGDAANLATTLADAGYVAAKAAEHDDTTALQRQINFLVDGDTWTSGAAGRNYAVSAPLTFGKHRCAIDFGALVPFGAYSDYLLRIEQGAAGPDATMPNISLLVNVRRLIVCGRWQSRGVRFADVYCSLLSGVRASHCYGTAIALSDCYENTWLNTVFTLNRNRVVDVSTATPWDGSTVYQVGQQCYVDYPAWNSGTTYVANDVVKQSGSLFRSIKDANTNNAPGALTGYWVREEYQFYQCQIVHLNGYPLSASPDYTTSGGTGHWKRVYPQEPMLSIGNDLVNAITDNQFFYGLDIRDNAAKELIRIDNIASGRLPAGIEFYGAEIEAMTLGIPWAVSGGASTGPLGSGATSDLQNTDARANSLFVRLVKGQRCVFVGCGIRPGGPGSTCMMIGSQHPNDQVSELQFQNVFLNGEDTYLIGLYVGVGQSEVAQGIGTVSIALPGTNSIGIIDPGQRLNNRGYIVPQQFADGNALRPGIAFAADPSTGFWHVTGKNLPQSRTAPTTDESFSVATTGFVYALLRAKGLIT